MSACDYGLNETNPCPDYVVVVEAPAETSQQKLNVKNIFAKIATSVVLLLSTGCASLTEGTTQTISVKTDRPCVASRGEQTASVTPEWSNLTVSKGFDPITIDCQGKVTVVESKVSGAGLVSIWLLDGGLIDSATGAMWKYPDTVDTAEVFGGEAE